MERGNQNLLIAGGLILAGVYVLPKILKKSEAIQQARDTFVTERYEIRSDKVAERFDTFQERQETKQLRQDKKQERISGDIEGIQDREERQDIRRDERTERTKIRQEAKTDRVAARNDPSTSSAKISSPKISSPTISTTTSAPKTSLANKIVGAVKAVSSVSPAKTIFKAISSKLKKK